MPFITRTGSHSDNAWFGTNNCPQLWLDIQRVLEALTNVTGMAEELHIVKKKEM